MRGAIVLTIVSVASSAGAPSTADVHLISESGIGPVRLEMTLGDLLRSGASCRRTSDGDGAALVEVRLANADPVIVSADEDDADSPIDWSKKIRTIETFSAAYHTAEGVHPGSLIVDVEKVYGKVTKIVESEIESRQYIWFERQPPRLTFRLDYTGIFPDHSRTTKEFDPAGTIYSIAISSL